MKKIKMTKETEFNLSKKKFPKETYIDRARESKTLENKRIANEEFDLSGKRQDRKHPNPKKPFNNEFTYPEEDVKEFIKLLKEEFEDEITEYNKKKIVAKIDKLAGKKLIKWRLNLI